MKKKTSTCDESVEVKAVYMGRRMATGGKLGWFWFYGGKSHGFKKNIAPAAAVGETWIIWIDDTSIMLGGDKRPRICVDTTKSHPDTKKWVAEDAACQIEYEAKRFERKLAARKSMLDKDIANLASYKVGLTPSDRVLFAQYVYLHILRSG